MNKHNIIIAVVDDHPIVIQGIVSLLAKYKNIQIAGTFNTGRDFMSFLPNNHIDVVLLDIMLPDDNGIDLCREIKIISSGTFVIALSNHTERGMILKMLQNGASGYILKNASVDEIINCIYAAVSGNIAFSDEIKAIIARPSLPELKGSPQLTKREKEVLQLVAQGKTTTTIADELFLSPLTVETHRKNLMKKFEAGNSIELVNLAKQHLIIKQNPD
ncbi:response regulator transcription factor [Mucilaginibacter jinjuensis]|uniref:Response regulator transcription factor n=1 Tax=Mucilaginibacter jinjuensis TaxID=1176721 RepID=A0ABY7T1P1_9SPHI|nr:response regulator transcription factor [Mucilaginibacter jinjuensis]WCT10173.1 response regulator transcription factor [Mucilaginibacter jinjuensis]